jgi:hypothetical protein
MLGLLKKVRRKAKIAKPFRRPLCLERLERRDTPTTPTLTFTASIVTGHWVSLTGQVTCDDSPTTARVSFSGVINDSVVPNADGSYGLLDQASALGTITAQVTDDVGQQSDPVPQTISCNAPALNVTSSFGAGGAVIFTGSISGPNIANVTITFNGTVVNTTQTNSNGTFQFSTTNWTPGNVQVQAVDLWDQGSNTVTVPLTADSPTITKFTAVQGADGLWTFSGHVNAFYAPGMTVQLWGIPTLNGTTGYTAVTVDTNGNFSLTVQLQHGEQGTVSAETWDWLGQASNIATDVVHQ